MTCAGAKRRSSIKQSRVSDGECDESQGTCFRDDRFPAPAQIGSVKAFTDFRPTSRPEPGEWELRQQLAAAYRITAYFGWDYLIYGHLSVRVPGPERHF